MSEGRKNMNPRKRCNGVRLLQRCVAVATVCGCCNGVRLLQRCVAVATVCGCCNGVWHLQIPPVDLSRVCLRMLQGCCRQVVADTLMTHRVGMRGIRRAEGLPCK